MINFAQSQATELMRELSDLEMFPLCEESLTSLKLIDEKIAALGKTRIKNPYFQHCLSVLREKAFNLRIFFKNKPALLQNSNASIINAPQQIQQHSLTGSQNGQVFIINNEPEIPESWVSSNHVSHSHQETIGFFGKFLNFLSAIAKFIAFLFSCIFLYKLDKEADL